jgi:collagenase-like PrtC family protease
VSRIAANTSTAKRIGDPFRIVAPANHPDEVAALAESGASEIYCGVLPAKWSARYGDWDCLSRRQGNVANLSSIEQLQEVARLAKSLGMGASLALNVRYTTEQIPDVLDLALAWEQAGGAAVLISSLAVLIGLQERGSRLFRHISILANVTNSHAVAFFRRLGARRVIFPRDLTIAEMAAVTANQPDIEYEAMALNDKCRFIDGLCGFYHGTTYPDATASIFAYDRKGGGGPPTVYAHDLCYAGHGCQVSFADERGKPIPQPLRDDVNHPACAACSLLDLHGVGVRFLKIGGRGLPTELKLRAVSYLRNAGELALHGTSLKRMRELYRDTFGQGCGSASCYYAPLQPRSDPCR